MKRPPPSPLRRLLLTAIAMMLPLALLGAVAEVVLRFLPVATGLHSQPVNAETPVFRFAANRDFIWSVGPDFAIVNRGRTNNAGYVSDIDYDRDDRRPLLAVIGDSYVEALMVPWRETVQARLATAAGPGARVYAFAASGAPLSQYLVFAASAVRDFGATHLVIVVVGNDFDESLSTYKHGPGFHLFVPAADGSLDLVRFDLAPSGLRRIVQRSALARYVIFNLQGNLAAARLRDLLLGKARADGYVGNVRATADPERVRLSEAAIDRFLDLLPRMTGLAPDRVLLVLDGRRPELYTAEGLAATERSYFARMRRSLIARAQTAGFGVIDLEPVFAAEHRRTGRRFEFEADAHWSGEGHRVAAEAVMASALWRAFRASGTTGAAN
jgi:hypothetical protein